MSASVAPGSSGFGGLSPTKPVVVAPPRTSETPVTPAVSKLLSSSTLGLIFSRVGAGPAAWSPETSAAFFAGRRVPKPGIRWAVARVSLRPRVPAGSDSVTASRPEPVGGVTVPDRRLSVETPPASPAWAASFSRACVRAQPATSRTPGPVARRGSGPTVTTWP